MFLKPNPTSPRGRPIHPRHEWTGLSGPFTVKKVEWDDDTSGYLLEDLAPYVHPGSYLTFHDEYGDLTVYRFAGGEVKIETVSTREEDEGI